MGVVGGMTKSIVKSQLELRVDRVGEFDGIQMGVMVDGTPFLTQRGLGAICGVVPSVITEWAKGYSPDSMRPRDQAITRLLSAQNYGGEQLYYEIVHAGQPVNAYPDAVCMAVLEYYAFESPQGGNREHALRNFRILARRSLRDFIYRTTGYDPQNAVPPSWRAFHDRMLLNRVPDGYFSVFREMSEVLVDAIRAGLVVDHHTVPDISVGQAWASHWKEKSLASVYGDRAPFPHTYPDYFPQSQAQPTANIYPVAALPEFRRWLRAEYLPVKYPAYLARKVSQGALPATRAELLIAAYADTSSA